MKQEEDHLLKTFEGLTMHHAIIINIALNMGPHADVLI